MFFKNDKFIAACEAGSLSRVHELLKKGADINARNKNGKTGLMCAVFSRNVSVVKELIREGADLNAQDKKGKTALMYAVEEGSAEIVDVLLIAGADLNIQDHDGDTALMYATMQEKEEIVEQLIKARADLDIQNAKGWTALIWSIINGHTIYSVILSRAGANLNLQDKTGRTALMWVVSREDLTAVQRLILAGADVSLINYEGKTAWDLASERGYDEIAHVLSVAMYRQKNGGQPQPQAVSAVRQNPQMIPQTPTQVISTTPQVTVKTSGTTQPQVTISTSVSNATTNVSQTGGQNKKTARVVKKSLPVKKKKSVRQRKLNIAVAEQKMSEEEQIAYYINYGRTFMLHGASGIGKTARIRAIDPDLTSVPLWNGVLPEDVLGKDVVLDGGKIEWVAPSWYTELCRKAAAEPDKKHVLFIDEVTNAKETTQSMIFNLVLNREVKVGKGKIPDNVTIVLAGNSKKESGAAYNMTEPLFRRMYAHIYLKDNVMDWIEWGSEPKKGEEERRNIHPLVAGYVATQGEQVFRTKYEEDEEEATVEDQYAVDPRGWEQVSDIIYDNGGQIRRELMKNKLGPELADDFLVYAQDPLLTLEEVVSGDYTAEDIPERADEKLALVCGLRWAKDEEYEQVRDFVEKHLGKEYAQQYDRLWAGKDEDRALKLEQARRAKAFAFDVINRLEIERSA